MDRILKYRTVSQCTPSLSLRRRCSTEWEEMDVGHPAHADVLNLRDFIGRYDLSKEVEKHLRKNKKNIKELIIPECIDKIYMGSYANLVYIELPHEMKKVHITDTPSLKNIELPMMKTCYSNQNMFTKVQEVNVILDNHVNIKNLTEVIENDPKTKIKMLGEHSELNL